MRVLMLSWEFPPRIVSGTATRVYSLSRSLVEKGAGVHVATCDFPNALPKETVDGIKVSRVGSSGFPQTDFLLWVINLNSMMIDKGDSILRMDGPFDLIHVHDWLLAMAAVELRNRFGLPLVTSIHASVFGRQDDGIRGYRKNIRSLENFLATESDRVICHSGQVLSQLIDNFELPESRRKAIELIPDGSDEPSPDRPALADPATAGAPVTKKNVLYVGDLTRKNEVVTLLQAIAKLRQQGVDVDLTVAGDGSQRGNLIAEVHALGIQRQVSFMGAVDHETLVTLYKLSDTIAVPSLYKESGFVVVAAMASLTPAVASDMSGITEIVENGMAGANVQPGDSNALAKAIFSSLVDNSSIARRNAPQPGATCDWGLVGSKTIRVYEGAMVAAGRQKAAKVPGRTA